MIKIETTEILFLQLVDKSGNLNNLVDDGLSYSGIAELMSQCIDSGLVQIDNNELKLTQDGREYLKKLNKLKHRKNSEVLISPLNQYILGYKLDKNDIYLPKDIDSLQ